eukprot:355623-Chlamydomonas_euryale.AAC.11
MHHACAAQLAIAVFEISCMKRRPRLRAHIVHDLVQLVPGLAGTLAVVGIDDEDDALSVLKVVAPQAADLHPHTHIYTPSKEQEAVRDSLGRYRSWTGINPGVEGSTIQQTYYDCA